MATVHLKGVKRVAATLADGTRRVYFYHRLTGARLAGEPGSPAFALRLAELDEAPKAAAAGSLAAIVERYLAAPEFTALKPASRRVYRIYLDDLKRRYGALPAAAISRRVVVAMRDDLAQRPAVANYTIGLLGRVLGLAADAGDIPFNPARGVPRLRHVAARRLLWPEAAIRRVMDAAPLELRVAVALGLYTGQRIGDCVGMRWADYDGTGIAVAQEKTAARLWIPAHRDLRAALGALRRGAGTILSSARPGLDRDGLRRRLRAWLATEGLAGLQFHGLRHTAATRLADAGCDDRDIMAITGHASHAMVARYTRAADQKRRATNAIRRLERTERNRKPENDPGPKRKMP